MKKLLFLITINLILVNGFGQNRYNLNIESDGDFIILDSLIFSNDTFYIDSMYSNFNYIFFDKNEINEWKVTICGDTITAIINLKEDYESLERMYYKLNKDYWELFNHYSNTLDNMEKILKGLK